MVEFKLMENVNKTLYIPLYGKAHVSAKGIILQDKKAEEIWSASNFTLKGKSKSKWLSYYMGMRASVFDLWSKEKLKENKDSIVIHIGCGLDSRVLRVNHHNAIWYDVDFPSVITERHKHYKESDTYHMIGGDAKDPSWLTDIKETKSAVVIMEGISMYLDKESIENLFATLSRHFDNVSVLMDAYSTLGAKASKYKNPINDVGVRSVFGFDDPAIFGLSFIKDHSMTPDEKIKELPRKEQKIFKMLYAGNFAKKIYRIYEYSKR